MTSFGQSLKESFGLKPGCVHANHGSWGAPPNEIVQKRTELLSLIESSPDDWFRRKRTQAWYESRDIAAAFLGSKPENLVFVANATTGINTILKCYGRRLQKGDAVLCQSWTYMAIQNTVKETCSIFDGEMLYVEMKLPVPDVDHVIQQYETMLSAHRNIKVAVIDYISSATATMFPVRELIDLCTKYDVISVIDGAHAPGQEELNLEELGADFFTGNLHKWVYCPRGCAVLWVHPRHHGYMRALTTSHCYAPSGSYTLDDFLFSGTNDDTQAIVSKHAIDFYNRIGGREVITAYTGALLEDAVHKMVQAFGTEKFPIPRAMEAPNMRIVRLPAMKRFPVPNSQEPFTDFSTEFMSEMWNAHGMAVTTLMVYGRAWLRLSAQVYNTAEDYEQVMNVIMQYANEK